MSEDCIVVVDYEGNELTDELIAQRLAELKALILGDRKLRNTRTDDEYLLRYLHCCNFNVEKAYERMQLFHNLVEEYSDWFIYSSPSDKKKQILTRAKAMLQRRDKYGRSVYLFRLGKIDVGSSDAKTEAQLDEIWFESVLNDAKTQASGISIIVDISGYSWKLFRWLTPNNVKVGSKALQLYPCKEIVFHVVNQSFLLKASVNIVWPFLAEDVKKRIKFHFTDWNSLHEHISPDVLPPEYGGYGPEINFEELGEWFLDQDQRIRKYFQYRQLNL